MLFGLRGARDGAEVRILGASRDRVELHEVELDRRPELEERLHLAEAGLRNAGAAVREPAEPARVHGGEVEVVRSVEVDELVADETPEEAPETDVVEDAAEVVVEDELEDLVVEEEAAEDDAAPETEDEVEDEAEAEEYAIWK